MSVNCSVLMHREVKVKEKEKSVSQEVKVTIETRGFIPFCFFVNLYFASNSYV